MALSTNIQWADGTVNPMPGCGGCELFPESPRRVLQAIDQAIQEVYSDWAPNRAAELLQQLVSNRIREIKGHPKYDPARHRDAVTLTNLWHLRERFASEVAETAGKSAASAVTRVINEQITCYAAKLHLNRGYSIVNPDRKPHPGYAPTFEQPRLFPERVKAMARVGDLYGARIERDAPWKAGLPRMIFVSDMGDALTLHSCEHLLWLDQHVLEPVRTGPGLNHIWQWLTKRPQNMAKFSDMVGGLPDNVCAMTTITSPDARNLKRVDDLRRVQAGSRGLSIEPLKERLPAAELDLSGIDWVILGGASGNRYAQSFDLSWARELRDHCIANDVAVFIKQLGRIPVDENGPIRLKDSHGGDWEEWPDDLRIRQFPRAFYEYRQDAIHSE